MYIVRTEGEIISKGDLYIKGSEILLNSPEASAVGGNYLVAPNLPRSSQVKHYTQEIY